MLRGMIPMRNLIGHGRLLAVAIAATMATGLVMAGCSTFGGRRHDTSNLSRFNGQEPPVTILLAEAHGPRAREEAEATAAELKEKGMDDVFVVADEDEAYLCHGLYDGITDENYKRDRMRVANIRDRSGKQVFGMAPPSPLPECEPPKSKYDISNADGQYTVMVGNFDAYNRMHDAEQYARKLRNDGWEAWVYHGEIRSHVTIGSFGRDIFDNPQRINNPLNPAVITSSEAKRVLEEFPYLYWNGHQFTEEEVEQLNVESDGPWKVQDPRDKKYYDLGRSYGELVRTKLVAIPHDQRRLNPDSMTGGGPILSPGR